MSRDIYAETIAYVMADGSMRVAPNVQVSVYELNLDGSRGSLAPLYAGRLGATSVDNPFLTDPSGLATFYADAGNYEIDFHDTVVPARIGDTTLGWSASPGDLQQTVIGFQTGDLKFSSLDHDHGYWLRLDGRTLTRTDVESALSLQAGDGQAIIDYLGTGSGSKYGSAPAGKILLPDARRRIPMVAGLASDPIGYGSGGLSVRALGATTGVETVQLTAAQSGMPAHTPVIHETNSGVTATYRHTHGVLVSTTLNRFTTKQGSGADIQPYGDAGTAVAKGGGGNTGTADDPPGDTVSVNDPPHNHVIDPIGAQNAASSHENMPPIITLGFYFIRI
jgi:microcystin-dependent protein